MHIEFKKRKIITIIEQKKRKGKRQDLTRPPLVLVLIFIDLSDIEKKSTESEIFHIHIYLTNKKKDFSIISLHFDRRESAI